MKKIQFVKVLYLPKGVNLFLKNRSLLLLNNASTIELKIPEDIYLEKKNHFLTLSFDSQLKTISWYYNFRNLLYGLNRGFKIRLLLKGVGFKVSFLANGDVKRDLELKLGHSHTIKHQVKEDISMELYKNTIINLKSPFKDLLGMEASKLHFLRKPDVYKGKGVLYKGSKLNLKVGKKA